MVEPNDAGTGTNPYDYMVNGNDASRVRLIKQYALFLMDPATASLPTSEEWKPASGLTPIGYNSDDGAELSPETGKSDDITGHNGDTVASISSGGNWKLKLTGIECRKQIAEAYFGVKADSNGGFHLDDAACNTEYALVLAGLDQYGKPIIISAGRAKVGDRESINFAYNKAVSFGITFNLLKPAQGHAVDIYGAFKKD